MNLLLHFWNGPPALTSTDRSLPGLPTAPSRLVLCDYAHIGGGREVSLVADGQGRTDLPAEGGRPVLDGVPYDHLAVLPADPAWLTQALVSRGVSPGALADDVITAAGHEAADVNAAGLYEQVEFLLSRGWIPHPLTSPKGGPPNG